MKVKLVWLQIYVLHHLTLFSEMLIKIKLVIREHNLDKKECVFNEDDIVNFTLQITVIFILKNFYIPNFK